MEDLPKYLELIKPLIKVLTDAGKPLSNSEIEAAIIKDLRIPTSLSSRIHSGNRTELQYRLAWARTKAKSSGDIFSPKRETWSVKNS